MLLALLTRESRCLAFHMGWKKRKEKRSDTEKEN